MVALEAERRADLEDIAMGTGDADQDIAVAKHINDAGCGVPVRLFRLSVAHEFDADVESPSRTSPMRLKRCETVSSSAKR